MLSFYNTFSFLDSFSVSWGNSRHRLQQPRQPRRISSTHSRYFPLSGLHSRISACLEMRPSISSCCLYLEIKVSLFMISSSNSSAACRETTKTVMGLAKCAWIPNQGPVDQSAIRLLNFVFIFQAQSKKLSLTERLPRYVFRKQTFWLVLVKTLQLYFVGQTHERKNLVG